MGVADRFYTPGIDTTNDGFEVDYREHLLDVNGVSVHIYEWRPEGEPVALIHISHGAGEHARRYQRLANDLTAAGYAVIANDHIGHGRTGVNNKGIGVMGVHGMRDSIRVVRRVIEWGKELYPGIPFVEFGHSWGSLMGQQILAINPTIFDAVVWSGTTLLIPGIANTGNFNEPWDGDGHGMSWLTRDKAEIKWMIDDRYGFDIGQSDMLDMPAVLGAFSVPRPLLMGRAARVPMYILGGSEDEVSNRGRGARALAWCYRHLSRMHDVTLRIYDGARHEVFNELIRADATTDLIEWLDWHLRAPSELGR